MPITLEKFKARLFSITAQLTRWRGIPADNVEPSDKTIDADNLSQTDDNERQPIVLMHVPKCAGTSLRTSLIEATGASTTLYGFDLCTLGNFDELQSLDSVVRDSIFVNGVPDGDFDFVGGHMSLSTLRTRFPRGRMITVMREPRVRLISYYFHWRSTSEEELSLWGSYASRIRLSHGHLRDFLHSKQIAPYTDNSFTRFLLWPHPDIPDGDFIHGESDDELFEEARKKIDVFDFVDILENQRLEDNIRKWLALPFALRKDHETRVRPDLRIDMREEFDAATNDRLNELTRIDSRLWLHCARKLAGMGDDLNCGEELLRSYKEYVTRVLAPEGRH